MSFDYQSYMRTYNRERKIALRAEGLCIDCSAESPRFVRCLECRRTMQEKAARRYDSKRKRNRVLFPI